VEDSQGRLEFVNKGVVEDNEGRGIHVKEGEVAGEDLIEGEICLFGTEQIILRSRVLGGELRDLLVTGYGMYPTSRSSGPIYYTYSTRHVNAAT